MAKVICDYCGARFKIRYHAKKGESPKGEKGDNICGSCLVIENMKRIDEIETTLEAFKARLEAGEVSPARSPLEVSYDEVLSKPRPGGGIVLDSVAVRILQLSIRDAMAVVKEHDAFEIKSLLQDLREKIGVAPPPEPTRKA